MEYKQIIKGYYDDNGDVRGIDIMNDVENSEVTEDTTTLSEPMNVSEVEETEINTIEADEVSETIDTVPETETAIQEENDTKE